MQKFSGTKEVSSDELTPDDDIYLNPIPGSRFGRIWKTTISGIRKKIEIVCQALWKRKKVYKGLWKIEITFGSWLE